MKMIQVLIFEFEFVACLIMGLSVTLFTFFFYLKHKLLISFSCIEVNLLVAMFFCWLQCFVVVFGPFYFAMH